MCSKQAYFQKWKAHHERHGGKHPGHFKKWARHGRQGPPVNILELDDRYEIHLAAPGRTKKDFNISMADTVLTITVEKKDSKDSGTWQRKEYTTAAFSRSFELNDKIDSDTIDAEYQNGILKLKLSKKEGFETQRKDIPIK